MLKTTVTKIFKFETVHQLTDSYSKETNTFTCPICNKSNIKSIIGHLNQKDDLDHFKFMQKFDAEIVNVIDYMVEDHLQIEINKELQKHIPCISPIRFANRIRNRVKELELNTRKIMGEKRKGLNNPVHKNSLTKIKIAESVKNKWEDGSYNKRINSRLGVIGKLHPNFDPFIHSIEKRRQRYFTDFLSEFQEINTCACCGNTKNKINIHHIDEDSSNFLPSNLEPLCIPCYMTYHYEQPYVKIGKYFTFAAAHQLPDHNGLCKYTHGHEWKVGIQIKKRINRKTGMVIDFSDLKQIVNEHVISILDHSFLNETIYNPTAENLLIWIWERLMFDGFLKGIHEIELWESSNSVATINEEGMRSVLIKKEKLGELSLLFPNYPYNKLIEKEE